MLSILLSNSNAVNAKLISDIIFLFKGTGRSLDLAKEGAAKDMLELLSLRSSSLNRSEGNRSFYGSNTKVNNEPI